MDSGLSSEVWNVSNAFSFNIEEYLGLGDGPPGFKLDFACPALLRILLGISAISSTGLLPSLINLPRLFDYNA